MEIRWPAWRSTLAPATVAALESAAARQRYPAGAALFVEGDTAHVVTVVQRGEVKVSVATESGREVVLDVLGPGDIIGELAAIDGGTRSATVTALTDVDVVSIASSTFRGIADEHPDLVEALLGEVIRRLRVSDRRQLEFGVDAIGRVSARLVEVAGRQPGGDVVLPVNQSELAAWTGLSREAVVKALASLRRLGWIETEGRRVRLLEPDQLRARASA